MDGYVCILYMICDMIDIYLIYVMSFPLNPCFYSKIKVYKNKLNYDESIPDWVYSILSLFCCSHYVIKSICEITESDVIMCNVSVTMSAAPTCSGHLETGPALSLLLHGQRLTIITMNTTLLQCYVT